ncbi:ShlB/FhaC/HecB family hemolysin secretion/activation protein [Halopseudomonas xinjiangensis]|uniref:ShlB/FhaC/HecB family hemolysin secretion/activation protein n=1 Tax=Halopseudomonas xinjiangensis TaxID=487184 RepID=UPI001560842B|nr:ShlB/FhaC/HecB family hemolysin secretion/activation protein [Halopseudomonas xinjiangensis]
MSATCLLALAGAAQAQTPSDIDAAARQAEQLQIQTRERIEQQRQRDISSGRAPTQLDVLPPETVDRTSALCRDIESISIEGASLLNQRAIDQLVEPYESSCMGVAEIERLLGAITVAYMKKGYVTARAYLPAQDLSTGTLTIEVEEGQLKEIKVEDAGKDSVSTFNVLPGGTGEPLNLRDLEQALDQINRLASNNATMDILPGTGPGDSIVVFHNQPSRRAHLGLTYDNNGQEATGQNQAGINLSLDNPFGLTDFVSFTHRRAHPYDTGRHSSYFNNLSYVLPLGYSTLSLNASNSEYASILDAPSGSELHTNGNSKNYSVRLDRVMWRGQGSMWTLSGSLTKKKSENYLESILLLVSSRSLTVFDLDSSFTTGLFGGALTLDAGVARGLDWFNSLEDAQGLPYWAPRAQFTKFKYGAGYFYPFALGTHRLSFSTQFQGQHAQNVLYGSEQISIGSLYTVRGFANASLAGDHGHYVRNELSLQQPFVLPGAQVAMLRPFLGLDYGRVWNRAGDVPEGELSSASVGASLSLGRLSLGIVHSRPISEPRFLEERAERENTFFNLSLSI